MAKRLNDTVGVRDVPLRGGDNPSPNLGEARFGRGLPPGSPAVRFDIRRNALEEYTVPEPSVGSECGRGAVAYLRGGRDSR